MCLMGDPVNVSFPLNFGVKNKLSLRIKISENTVNLLLTNNTIRTHCSAERGHHISCKVAVGSDYT